MGSIPSFIKEGYGVRNIFRNIVRFGSNDFSGLWFKKAGMKDFYCDVNFNSFN